MKFHILLLSGCHSRSPQFDSELRTRYISLKTFHHINVYKLSTKFAWKLNAKDHAHPLPDWDILSRKQEWVLWPVVVCGL